MFSEVDFILNHFLDRCADPNPGGIYKNLDKTISKVAMECVVMQWLDRRFGGPGRATNIDTLYDSAMEAAAKVAKVSLDQKEWSMRDTLAFISHYQVAHLDQEKHAGFAANDIEGFETLFNDYHGGGPIKARELWEVLSDLGYDFPSRTQQAYVLNILAGMKLQQQGQITFEELLKVLRRCVEDKKVDERQREHDLIVKSDMELDECDGWLGVFQVESGDTGSILMSDIKA